MRVALCLSGYFNSLKDLTSRGMDGYDHIQRKILSKRQEGHTIDVFFHNWEPDSEQLLVELYDPKKYIVENQIDFDMIAKENGVDRSSIDPHGQLGSWTVNSQSGVGYVGPERILSQFYSVQKSMELKREYEKEHNFKYDCVIKSRFDLGRINRDTSGPGRINPYACQCINFEPEQDMNFLYVANWDLFNEGPADMWYYSSSENMDNFCELYNNALHEYMKPNSEFQKKITSGWIESKLNEFRTNELFKPKEEQAKLLHKYPPHMICNAILLQKWFLIKCGLWEKMKPLDTEWE